MPKKDCDAIAKENEELKKALKESVEIIEKAQDEIGELKESKNEPIIIRESCPHRKPAIYGVDKDGVPYDGLSLPLSAAFGKPIFATEQINKKSEADQKLDEFMKDRRETDQLLAEIRKAIDSIPPEYLRRCDQIAREKRNRGMTVGGYDQESKKWELEKTESPQSEAMDGTKKLLAGARIDVAGPRQTFSSSKESNWDPEVHHWHGGNKSPDKSEGLTVGTFESQTREWKGSVTNDKTFVVSRSSTGETSPPDKRCPENIPKLGWGTLEVCKGCEYQIWCLKQIPKTQETASSNDYRHPTSTVCPHADEIPEEKMGKSALCQRCPNNTYPYGNYCKLKKEASKT
jgi:hypothetical protein